MNESTKASKLETKPDFHGKYRRFILSGTKRVTIRKGNRRYAKNLEVCGYVATMESVTYYKRLLDVPFVILQMEDWRSFSHALDELRNLYPDITPDTDVTVVEFRINIPPTEVSK